jgi:DNA polymerase III delta subunit
MIYIVYGNDTKAKSAFLRKITLNRDTTRITQSDVSRELLKNYADSTSLFGDSPIIIVENMINESDVSLSSADLKSLQSSSTIFILIEDKLLASDQKKYKTYANIENFEEKAAKKMPKINTFAIADSFARRDKVSTWMLYREAIEGNIEPEAISGMLFWKIKTMVLNGTRVFSQDELKKLSSGIVSIYHRAHRGELDFVIGLEQFILSSLSK